MASSSVPIAASSPTASSSSATPITSPCAACKFLRRKCHPDCVFAPYFPPDQQQKFINVHRVFGASNVTKLLNELQPYQREDAVNSLAYEADMRLRDPVYGCVGVISILQHQLRQLQADLTRAKFELSQYQTAAGATAAHAGGYAPVGVGGGGSAHEFININNHPIAMGGLPFGREQFFSGILRDNHHSHMMMKNYDAELGAKLGMSGGGYMNGASYDAGILAAMNTTNESIGPLISPFMKSGQAGGDERPSSIGPS